MICATFFIAANILKKPEKFLIFSGLHFNLWEAQSGFLPLTGLGILELPKDKRNDSGDNPGAYYHHDKKIIPDIVIG